METTTTETKKKRSKKSADVTTSEPAVETAETVKVPRLNKDGSPRKKADRLPPVKGLVAKLTKYVSDEEKAVARATLLGKRFTSYETRLIRWGKVQEGQNLMATELLDIAKAAEAEGFEPPKSERTAKVTETFIEGQPVQIKADFASAYSHVYSDVERGSMLYAFYDEVNKRAMCKTDARMMIVKVNHIESRDTVQAGDVQSAA